mmetsp:Transcript_125984/g.362314  ORF Transcript_125984/g.362314 Transcript_125984/m.362314 type:complete len:82 (-) Transcript_125984:22-267(-)
MPTCVEAQQPQAARPAGFDVCDQHAKTFVIGKHRHFFGVLVVRGPAPFEYEARPAGACCLQCRAFTFVCRTVRGFLKPLGR